MAMQRDGSAERLSGDGMLRVHRRQLVKGAAAAVLLAPFAGAAASARPTKTAPPEPKTLVEGLAFPEGLFTLPDGSFGCVEIAAATLVRFAPDGRRTSSIAVGGGPNGAAVGPDGNIYLANDGGLSFAKTNGVYSITGVPQSYVSGSVQKVDRKTGAVSTLYDRVGDHMLKGPNDLCFADSKGFWFTDTGKIHNGVQDKGGLYWAAIDGSDIRQVVYPLESPNGIALSPDRKTLYVALSNGRQIMAYPIAGPGILGAQGGRVIATVPGNLILDNIAVEQSGNIVIATVIKGGLMTIDPKGKVLDFLPLPDMAVTAVAFGGPGHKTLFATLSTTGRIVAIPWPRPGLPSLFGRRAIKP